MTARPNVAPQEGAMMLAPLAAGIERGAVAQERCHQAGEQEGQGVALPAPRPRVWNGGEDHRQVANVLLRAWQRAQHLAHRLQHCRLHTDRLLSPTVRAPTLSAYQRTPVLLVSRLFTNRATPKFRLLRFAPSRASGLRLCGEGTRRLRSGA